MGKAKPKRNLADKVRRTKKTVDVRANPFEVKINRQKFSVIGRKPKHDRGLPGVSRSKSIKKRMGTLLQEHKQKNKSNVFVDRRIGENDASISLEDKMLQRFAKERQRQHTRENVFALHEADDEEQLTHYGQSLADVQALGDAPDSDSDTGDRGLLSAEFTEAHFGGGGGLLRRKKAAAAPVGEGEDGGGGAAAEVPHRSRKELIEELITKSKKEKFERQNAREQTLELTEKLDADWKLIQSLLPHKSPKALRAEAEDDAPRMEAYDVAVRELAFEIKAQPSERLKTAEEMAREEAQRLQHLEAARLRRMRGAFEEKAQSERPKHLSADDLHDGFDVDDEPAAPALAYEDGKLKTVTWADEATAAHGDSDEEDDPGEEQGEEDEEEEDDDADDDSDGDDDHSDLESDEQAGSEEDDKEEEEEEMDGFVLKLALSVDGEEEDGEEEDGEDEDGEPGGPIGDGRRTQAVQQQAAPLLHERRQAMEAASREMPFTFPVPTSAQELRTLLDGYRPEQRATVLARVQACTHPSLAEGNKAKLGVLCGFVLEYVGELARRCPPDLPTVDLLIRPLYDLARLCPRQAGIDFQAVLAAGQSELSQHGRPPSLDQLVYLKLVSLIFPTSDFRHPVVTPATVYLSQILSQCAVSSLRAVGVSLFACHLLLEFVRLSQRFVPELLVHLHGLLVLALPPHAAPGVRAVPPFRAGVRGRGLLVVRDAASLASWSQAPLSLSAVIQLQREDGATAATAAPANTTTVATDTAPEAATAAVAAVATAATATHDHFRISAVGLCLELVQECVRAYAQLPSRTPAFQPLRELLGTHLDLSNYPPSFQAMVEEIKADLDAPQMLTLLKFEKSRPQPLKMFQPKVEQVLEFGRKKAGSRPEKDRKRLVAQHKKEWKGAVREIRRDTQFLAREQLKEQMDRDSERKRKVKELHHLLATQEGEWKALKRKKMKA
ncbi:nucleolar protein 14 [Lampetra fluviatilis]